MIKFQIQNTQYLILKKIMGLLRPHKSIFISTLSIMSGNFGTNGTVFHSFFEFALFFQWFSVFFLSHLVPISLFQSHLIPIR